MREIVYSNKLTINTGNYENESPMFSEKIILDNPSEEDVFNAYSQIRRNVDGMLASYKMLNFSKDEPSHYTEINGKMYPRVTSIVGQTVNWSSIPNLHMYADEGMRVHNEIEEQIKNKKYKTITGYEWEKVLGNIKELLKKDLIIEERLISDKPMYTGKPDVMVYENKKLIAVVDWKTGKFKEDYYMQLSAYAKAKGFTKNTKLVVCELKTGEVFETNEIQKYYDRFDLLRKVYLARYAK